MKYNYYKILIICLSFSFSAIEATTEDGKKVILHNDGIWKFENPAENAKFNLVEFIDARFEKHEKHYGREEKPFEAHVRGFFQFQNNSDRKIRKSFRIFITLYLKSIISYFEHSPNFQQLKR